MEKREAFIQAVSKELVEEFLQFLQLDVSYVFYFYCSLTLDVLKSCHRVKYSSLNECLFLKS
jgi:hypothetical protein